jgi:hypothetical protein
LGLVGLGAAVWFKLMDDMHLQVFESAIDRMLGWRMEMCLQAEEIRHLDLLVEQVDGPGRKHIVSGGTIQDNLELFTLLFVLDLCRWVHMLVGKPDVIGKVSQDLLLGRKVNWCTELSELAQVVLCVRTFELLVPRCVHELDFNLLVDELSVEVLEVTGSLCDWVLEILREIEVEGVLVHLDAPRHAANHWQSGTLNAWTPDLFLG